MSAQWSNRSSGLVTRRGHVNICGRQVILDSPTSGRLSSIFTKNGYVMSGTHSDVESSLGFTGNSARAHKLQTLDDFLSHHATMKPITPHPKHMNRSQAFLFLHSSNIQLAKVIDQFADPPVSSSGYLQSRAHTTVVRK